MVRSELQIKSASDEQNVHRMTTEKNEGDFFLFDVVEGTLQSS